MSSILNSLLSKVEAVQDGLQSGALIRDAVGQHGDDIMELQIEQLFEGKAASGDDLRPYYSEDLKPGGYFYSAESAGRYAAWKQTISPGTNRNPDAPNLYINGRFHSELGVVFDDEEMTIVGETGYARGIVAKYGLSSFGLTAENWVQVWSRGAYDDLMEGIKKLIYE